VQPIDVIRNNAVMAVTIAVFGYILHLPSRHLHKIAMSFSADLPLLSRGNNDFVFQRKNCLKFDV
jgi:hypothetical protein